MIAAITAAHRTTAMVETVQMETLMVIGMVETETRMETMATATHAIDGTTAITGRIATPITETIRQTLVETDMITVIATLTVTKVETEMETGTITGMTTVTTGMKTVTTAAITKAEIAIGIEIQTRIRIETAHTPPNVNTLQPGTVHDPAHLVNTQTADTHPK